jgi:hypothetical protein
LGFCVEGKYLVSYRCRLEENGDAGTQQYSYTMLIWRFAFNTKLQLVRLIAHSAQVDSMH